MLATSKTDLLKELKRRVEDKILEPTNYELLKKLIEKADTLDEAIMITELGTTYKRTGFHFDKRLEKLSDTIKYFRKMMLFPLKQIQVKSIISLLLAITILHC